MQYRELTDLTDDEITFIVNEIFHPKKIENIARDEKCKEITCDITTTWGDGTVEDPYTDITDEIGLTENELGVYDFQVFEDEKLRWKQFLVAKGCNYLLKDNPYLKME